MPYTKRPTLVHARFEKVLGQTEGLSFIFTSLLANQGAQLFLQQVPDDGESIDRHLLVGNVCVLDKVSTGKVVKIIAGFYGRVDGV